MRNTIMRPFKQLSPLRRTDGYIFGNDRVITSRQRQTSSQRTPPVFFNSFRVTEHLLKSVKNTVMLSGRAIYREQSKS